jgi:hypothetical protein
MRSRAVRAALTGAALLGATLLPASASAAAATSPEAGLARARSELGALAASAGSPATRRLLSAAEGQLAAATAPALWVDAGQPAAPPYGATVFAHSRAALTALEGVPSSGTGAGAVSGVVSTVLVADRTLAFAAIRQAAGGEGGLLFRAGGMILSGDRWAQTSRVDLGAVQYGVAWREAYQALTLLVGLRVSLVSTPAVGRGAESALARGAVAPAGVRALAGRAPLSRDGKPEVLFVGTESCRFCAIERWGLVAALSQFGTFTNLHLSQSATTDQPIVRSFTFHGSSYDSLYVAFDPVELTSSVPIPGGGYQPLDRLTAPQRTLMRALDPAPAVPFLDVANQFADAGATVSTDALNGMPYGALSVALRRPKTPAGQAIAATAEVITAEICHATGGAPAAVCDSPAVHDYASRLARFGRRGAGCPVTLEVARPAMARTPTALARR